MMREQAHGSPTVHTTPVVTTALNYLLLLSLLLLLTGCGGGGSGGGGGDDPVIDALAPSTVTAGSGGVAITVRGSGFVADSEVRVDVAAASSGAGAAGPMGAEVRTTTYVSSTQLSVELEPGDVAAAGTASITVFNPDPGNESGARTLTIENAPPTTTGLAPSSTQVGGPGFNLLVNGSGFVDGSVVNWGGSARATTYISGEQLAAAISAADIATIADVNVTVETPSALGPGGGTSNSQTFQVGAQPQPEIVGLSPSGAVVGSGAFVLTVDGNNFQPTSEVRWNGAMRATTFVSVARLTAQIGAADVATLGANNVTVFTPGVGGGSDGESAPMAFNVSPAPSISTLAPDNILVGSNAFTLTVNGANFLNGATVLWGGMARTTTVVGSGQLTAAIAASDVAVAGIVNVTVLNPDSGMSNALGFTVNPLPSIANLMPNNADVGDAFTLTVNGADFLNGALVRWNGVVLATTFGDSTQLTAAVTTVQTANTGTATITVLNPDGGVSGNAMFTVDNPVPIANSLSPSSATPGGPGFPLVVAGSDFVSGAVVRWNGVDRATTFDSSAQLTAQILMGDIAAMGNATVTVFNPAPGGGVSNPRTFSINPIAVPVLDTLTPDNAAVSAGFAMTVEGSDFDPSSVVRWGFESTVLATTFESATELTATVTASQTAAAGCVPVEVYTPAGGTSNIATFTVGPGTCSPIPVLDNLQPRSAEAGDGALTLDVIGSGFTANSVVRWDGSDRTTTFVSDTLLEASIPSADLVAVDNVAVTVFTPGSPGAGSQPDTFFVLASGQTVFYDNFNRADNDDIGNGWVEKTPSIFSLNGGEITGTSGITVFDNNIVYRPDVDTVDVEASMEFIVTSSVADRPTYPQVHARIDPADVGQAEQLSSYTLFYDKDAASMVVTPIDNREECYLSLWPIPGGILDTGERYRMRFIVTGTDPVNLRGILDQFVNEAWQVLVDQTVQHDDNTQPLNDPDAFCNTPGGVMLPPVTQSGTVGFAKWMEASERLDNFYSIPLP